MTQATVVGPKRLADFVNGVEEHSEARPELKEGRRWRYVTTSSEEDSKVISLTGGKGKSLAILDTETSVRIPKFFTVTTEGYFYFLKYNGLIEAIKKHTRRLDYRHPHEVRERTKILRAEIERAIIPPDMAEEIIEAYQEIGGGRVAVRSSATAEDLPEASFAGQQRTFLNIQGNEAVLRAIILDFASLFTHTATSYRRAAGYRKHHKVGLAVPVQVMVQAKTAGVGFSVEPVSSDPTKIVVEGGDGLGEYIVGGEETPSMYVLDKATLTILWDLCRTGEQRHRLVQNPNYDGTNDPNISEAVEEERVYADKLTPDQVIEVARAIRDLEECFGAPVDTEWAFDANGVLLFTQARPVTTMREKNPLVPPDPKSLPQPVLLGNAAAPGVGVGRVKLVLDPSEEGSVTTDHALFAVMTSPDFVPAMKRSKCVCTLRGGRTCHAAIVSRELGKPCVVGMTLPDGRHVELGIYEIEEDGKIVRVLGTKSDDGSIEVILRDGEEVTCNGETGAIYRGRVEVLVEWWSHYENRFAYARKYITRTRVYVNLAEPEMANEVVKTYNPGGIGLLRAEFMAARLGHPRQAIEDGKRAEYVQKMVAQIKRFLRAFRRRQLVGLKPKPVVYRLFDFKSNEYRDLPGGEKWEIVEENPMIGFRGADREISDHLVTLMEFDIIKEVRREFPNLIVMIPFIRDAAEVRILKAIMAEHGLVREADGGTDGFKLWAMIETPAAAINVDKIAREVDGLSIGTNDLTQLVLGIDRDSEKVAPIFDELNSAVLWAVERIVKAARRAGITISVCGQAPSVHLSFVELLVRLGATSVSVSPDAFDATKKLIAEMEAKKMKRTVEEDQKILRAEEFAERRAAREAAKTQVA